jgi:hypothetical protein
VAAEAEAKQVEKAWAIVSMLKGCGADLNKRAKGESFGPARKVSTQVSRFQDLLFSWPSAQGFD